MVKFIKVLVDIIVCKLLFRVKYINYDNIKNVDKCIVCSNHSTAYDPFFLFPKLDFFCAMAKKELFRYKILSYFFKKLGIFPIDRGNKDFTSIFHAVNLFKDVDKRKLVIFPEGTRIKKNKARGKAKIGPVYISSKANVPIIPVYIKKNPHIFSKVYVIFGKKIDVPTNISKDKEELAKYSNMILDTIYDMGKANEKK